MRRRELISILKSIQACYPSQKGYAEEFIDILFSDFGRMNNKIFALIAKQLTYRCTFLPSLKDFQDELIVFVEKIKLLPAGWTTVSEKVETEQTKKLGMDFYKMFIVNTATGKKYPYEKLKKISKDMLLSGEIDFNTIEKRIAGQYKYRYNKQLPSE